MPSDEPTQESPDAVEGHRADRVKGPPVLDYRPKGSRRRGLFVSDAGCTAVILTVLIAPVVIVVIAFIMALLSPWGVFSL